MKSGKDPILTPELLKIIKIFGLASIALVLVFSLFNEKRANNTGDDLTFRVNDSNRLFFLNLKAIHYNQEKNQDAKMTLYRHSDLSYSEDEVGLIPIILLNPGKDEAYLYLEAINTDWPLKIKAVVAQDSTEFQFENGNREQFLAYVNNIRPWMDQEANFFIKINEKWTPLWSTPDEKKALEETLNDYFQLLEQ